MHATATDERGPSEGPEDLVEYASRKHLERMRQITDASEEIPDLEQLVDIDGGSAYGDD